MANGKYMKLISYCNSILALSFYTLFLLVPLTFNGSTSELFELNKMWLTFGMTIMIGATWFTKMVVQKKIAIQRTPFDIPLLLFLISQIISTLISMDQHVSWWGYYSRFNGGLLSTICYIFLYYAFVTNLTREQTLRTIYISLLSGLGVVLWGIPSHFGADPTCFVFRGTFDTSCWTEAFKPTIRAFSTLGQPAWLAAYLAALLPLTMVFYLKPLLAKKKLIHAAAALLLVSLFYISLAFANTRAGFLAFFVADIIFWLGVFVLHCFSWKKFLMYAGVFHITLILCSFFFGAPLGSLHKYTFGEIIKQTAPAATPTTPTQPGVTAQQQAAPLDSISGVNITDSGKIRLLVWQGAIDAWKSSPLFGTGVETFAFAYYRYKSPEHNLTSEWDYLYNKAHNEYLNYLTTTGIFGLSTYLLFIGFFIFFFCKYLVAQNRNEERTKPKQYHSLLVIERIITFLIIYFKEKTAKRSVEENETVLLSLALFSGWMSILISNFFGFSVVIINLFFFFFPAWVLILTHHRNLENQRTFSLGETATKTREINAYQGTLLAVILIIAGWMLLGLFRYWYADVAYALGNNLNKSGSPQEAYPQLKDAVATIPNEPVYLDELSINLGTLSTALAMQGDTQNSAQLAKDAVILSDQVIATHPNNIVYWKNRVRLFYTLSQGDKAKQSEYMTQALLAIQKAYELSPNDAKIIYNYGILLGQTGQLDKGIEMLQKVIQMKPDYADAYFALGLFYRQSAVNEADVVVNPEMNQKAIETYEFLQQHFGVENEEVKKSLETWKAQ